MKKNIIAAILFCLPVSVMAAGKPQLSGPTGFTKEQCQATCVPKNCHNTDIKMKCLKDCESVNIASCLDTPLVITKLSDVNTAAGVRKILFTKKLLQTAPLATNYLDSGAFPDKNDYNKKPPAEAFKDIIYVISNLRKMCVETVEQNVKLGGVEPRALDQLRDSLSRVDNILTQINKRAMSIDQEDPADAAKPFTNRDLKNEVGLAELNVKTCIQQGSQLHEEARLRLDAESRLSQYQANHPQAKKTSEKFKSFLKGAIAPFTCISCQTKKCLVDVGVYTKCREKCPPKYSSKCMVMAAQSRTPAYEAYQKK